MLAKRILVLGLVSSALAWNVQNPDIVLPPTAAVNKARVVELFQDSYAAYKWVLFTFGAEALLTFTERKYAFPNDDLQPVSRSTFQRSIVRFTFDA